MDSWVYILRCSDGAYYVGSHRGPDVGRRVGEHQAGINPRAFTYRRRPVELVWAERFQSVLDAVAFERRVKGWSRAKKEALMQGDWNELVRLVKGGVKPRPSTSSG